MARGDRPFADMDDLWRRAGVPVAAVVGDLAPATVAPFPVASLVETCGRDAALVDPLRSAARAVTSILA